MVGEPEGAAEGRNVGASVGEPGTYVGENVGPADGAAVGDVVGKGVGSPGSYVGDNVGL